MGIDVWQTFRRGGFGVHRSNAVPTDNKLSVSGGQQAATVRCTGQKLAKWIINYDITSPLADERNQREKLCPPFFHASKFDSSRARATFKITRYFYEIKLKMKTIDRTIVNLNDRTNSRYIRLYFSNISRVDSWYREQEIRNRKFHWYHVVIPRRIGRSIFHERGRHGSVQDWFASSIKLAFSILFRMWLTDIRCYFVGRMAAL